MRCSLMTGLVVGLFAVESFGFELHRDSTGAEVKWAHDVEFIASTSLDSQLHAPGAIDAIKRAAAKWSSVAGSLRVKVTPGETHGVAFDGRSEIVSIDEDWPYRSHVLAVTVVTVNTKTHEVVEADIAINADENHFAVLDETSVRGGTKDDVQNAITHEFGHAVGLEHSMAMAVAVMYPEAFSGEVNKRTLSVDDVDGAVAIYGPPSVEIPKEEPVPTQGCSSSGGQPMPWILVTLMAVMMARRTRKTKTSMKRVSSHAAVAGLLFAGSALAQVPAVGNANTAAANVGVALTPKQPLKCVGRVTALKAVPPERGIFFTEVTLTIHECVTGEAGETLTVRVPGGTWGDLQQYVEEQPVPPVGVRVGVEVIPADARHPQRSTVMMLSSETAVLRFLIAR